MKSWLMRPKGNTRFGGNFVTLRNGYKIRSLPAFFSLVMVGICGLNLQPPGDYERTRMKVKATTLKIGCRQKAPELCSRITNAEAAFPLDFYYVKY